MSEMEIAILNTKLAIYEQKRREDAAEIAQLKVELAATKEKLEGVEADRDGCCEEIEKREAVITALDVLWMTISDKFPEKWDHLQYDLNDENGTVVLKTVEEVIRKVEKTDSLVLYCCH